MALTAASVIALAAGGVATGLSYSYQHQDDYRQTVQDASGVIRELRAQVSKAQLITGAWTTSAAFWTDTNADMAFTLSELTLIQYNATNKQVTETRLVFPASFGPSTSVMPVGPNVTSAETMPR